LIEAHRVLFLRSRKKSSTKTVRRIARAIKAKELCPAPKMIGIGPTIMTAPPLPFRFRLESDSKVINRTPMKIIANAANNNHMAKEDGPVIGDSASLAVGMILV